MAEAREHQRCGVCAVVAWALAAIPVLGGVGLGVWGAWVWAQPHIVSRWWVGALGAMGFVMFVGMARSALGKPHCQL